jgi:hypothetical protein
MKKIYCDSCGKEILFDNTLEHWNKVVVTEIDDKGRATVPSTEAYDVCRECWNRIKRLLNFEKKLYNICQKCGCSVIGNHKNGEGKILCTTCEDNIEKHKPDRDKHY